MSEESQFWKGNSDKIDEILEGRESPLNPELLNSDYEKIGQYFKSSPGTNVNNAYRGPIREDMDYEELGNYFSNNSMRIRNYFNIMDRAYARIRTR